MNLIQIKEYFKLIGKGIENFDSVLAGIVNDVKLKFGHIQPEIQDEIIRRRLICKTCPFNNENATTSQEFKTINNGQVYKDLANRTDLHCAICHCNVDYKTASMMEKCGLSYYNDLNPNNKLPLKWEEFKN